MRPTDDERREVAARLRDMAPGSDWPNYVAEACGMDVSKMSNNLHTFTEQLCQRIADLIEPEERTCRDVSSGDEEFRCSEWGAPVEVECHGITLLIGGKADNISYCPNCKARVVKGDAE